MSDRIVIKNGTVVTMNDADDVIFGGTVVIENDRIVDVGPASEVATRTREDGARVLDATDKAILPGLVDLHYHTALGKGWSDHLPLWEYLETCWYPIIRALDSDAAYWAALASYSESIKCGVTTVNDMYRKLDGLARAAEEIGIRAVLSNDIADDEHKLDTLEDNRTAFEQSNGAADGRIEVYIGIEWLPLASEGLLREARALADDLGTGIHIHLNESLTEVRKFASLIHRASRVDPSRQQAPDVVRMATRNGSAALKHETGELTKGKKADVILVDLDNQMFTPLFPGSKAHLYSHLVFAANGSAVHTTIIDGRIVYEAREFTTIDEKKALHEANAAFREVLDRMVVPT